ncbi:MAG: hypothetical protein NXH86_04135 [Flavobacteriaceae bacterium]|nr:hypothetical protein [Flavobacteriaceae bacterium]
MADGRKNNGGHKNAGRKPKAEEQELIEKLSPLEDSAFKALTNALSEEKPWAVKMFMEYRYGKPKEVKDLNIVDMQRVFVIDE